MILLPKRLAQIICNENKVSGNICEISNKILKQLSDSINAWVINPQVQRDIEQLKLHWEELIQTNYLLKL